MFVLSKDEERFVLFPCKPVYTVGRLSTDLIIQEDLSVSRTHVKLHLAAKEDDTLQVEDLGSRYGTFIFPRNAKEAKKIPARTLTPLTAGTRVRFGGNTSVWQVTQLKLVTTASALTRTQVQELEELLKPLGGVVSLNWTEECSHLTMNEATVTVKLLHALLENKPIVTFAFWRKLLQAAQSIHVKEGWPQPKDYQPTNMDVKWRPERTTLFAGKTFVFMNRKHFEIYGAVVQKAGAACKDLNSGVRKTFLTKKDVIVIQYVPSTQSQATETINSIQGILEQAGLRIIQEYEIGTALLHCSIKEFCNPAHKFSNDSLPPTESVTSSMDFNSSILAPNTERSVGRSSGGIISELIVPESEQSETSKSAALKRNHAVILDSEEEEQEKSASKRAKPMLQEKPKGKTKKNAILVDSSDEDEAPAPQPQNTHIKQKTRPVYCVDSSDEDEENVNNDAEKPKESPAPGANTPKASKKTESKIKGIAQFALKKPEVPPAVTRTSPRLKANTEARNITNKQPEMPVAQAKRSVAQFLNDEEDEDDAATLFQFSKSPQKPPTTKANKPPGRISMINFLEKSQPQESSAESQPPSQSQTQPRKRLRLEPLNESDSDDCEDLFNFADSKRKKQKQQEQTNNDDVNDGLFNFNNSEGRHSDAVNQDFVQTEPFCPERECEKAKSKYIVPQRKDLPQKVDVSGWLSCSRLHNEDIKSEANVSLEMAAKLENSIKEDPDAEEEDSKKHLKWLAAMNDGIQVRMCNLNISTTRSTDEVDGSSLNGTASTYSGRKNFKKFVKTCNPHPQRRVVGLKRLQLVDGMVTCL